LKKNGSKREFGVWSLEFGVWNQKKIMIMKLIILKLLNNSAKRISPIFVEKMTKGQRDKNK